MQQPVIPADPRLALVPGPEDAVDATEFPYIPGYRFQKRLGQGGMATVYLATQESLDRPVSIKVMEHEALEDETSMQRFENEARTIAKLTHPSIVNIHEVGRTADARMYYIMPYLPNGDLAQRDLRHNETRIVEVLRTLLSALDYAHARGIVHRDVKEENVLFDAADRPLLTDFGIALSKRDTSRITTAGLAVGSSGYMAPEQARGDVVDGRADLYSVGVMAYELLTGKLPFRSPDPLTLALMHVQNPIPRLPPEKRHWQAFIDRAMAKSPSQRFRDAQQMLQALDRVDRRTGNHLGGKLLRRYDDTVHGKIWKRPGTIALTGAVLVAVGLYSARDQLPAFGASAATSQAQPAAPANAAASTVSAPPAITLPTTSPAKSDTAVMTAASAPAKPVATAAADAPASTATKVTPSLQIATPATANAKPAASNTDVAPAAIVSKPSVAPASISPDAAVLGEARDALAHANLTAPADDNAVDLTRMAWKLSPATANTQSLASDVLKAISVQQALAIGQHKDQRVLEFQHKAQQLADATIGRTVPTWRALHTNAATAIGKRVQIESDASDTAALKRTQSLAKRLDLSDVYAKAFAAAQQNPSAATTTATTASAAASLGPGFVLLPIAPKSRELAAISRGAVTHHEYAQFVNATRRHAAVCGDPKAATRKNWSTTSAIEQPVLCVSWSDASAYVQWLGAQKGQHYRLPSASDWRAVGASVSSANPEWLQNQLLATRGGGTTAGREAGQGFDDVGFRIVRVLDAHH